MNMNLSDPNGYILREVWLLKYDNRYHTGMIIHHFASNVFMFEL